PRDDSSNAIALRETLALEEQHLIVLEAVRVAQLGTRRRIAVELDPACVRHLAASGRVERRLAHLREEEPVLELFHRAELREDVGLLVADELRAESGRVRELRGALIVARDRRARALALLCHERGELLVVDAEATLASELLRELEREAVRVVQPKRVLAGDVAAFRRDRDVLEEAHPARERLAEAFLLGREHAVDLRAVLLELGVSLSHLLDDDVGEPCEVGRLEPDTPRLLHGAADD